jgi:hypothetical protein
VRCGYKLHRWIEFPDKKSEYIAFVIVRVPYAWFFGPADVHKLLKAFSVERTSIGKRDRFDSERFGAPQKRLKPMIVRGVKKNHKGFIS